jgi:hypothetical protein
LIEIFHEERKPFVSLKRLQKLIFKDAGIEFNKDVKLMTEVLWKDLATNKDKSELINLKELRDQLLGRRIDSGLVFMWGINDDRTCKKQRGRDNSRVNDAKEPEIDSLIPPIQIEFDD